MCVQRKDKNYAGGEDMRHWTWKREVERKKEQKSEHLFHISQWSHLRRQNGPTISIPCVHHTYGQKPGANSKPFLLPEWNWIEMWLVVYPYESNHMSERLFSESTAFPFILKQFQVCRVCKSCVYNKLKCLKFEVCPFKTKMAFVVAPQWKH